jgi:hypothetical protein
MNNDVEGVSVDSYWAVRLRYSVLRIKNADVVEGKAMVAGKVCRSVPFRCVARAANVPPAVPLAHAPSIYRHVILPPVFPD